MPGTELHDDWLHRKVSDALVLCSPKNICSMNDSTNARFERCDATEQALDLLLDILDSNPDYVTLG